MPTSPEVARQVIAANKRLFEWARGVKIPVIHFLTQYRDVAEIACNPFWRTRAEDPKATRKNVLRHNIAGMPGVAIIPELYDRQRDFVVDTKKRYDCFLGTDLEFTLAGARYQYAADHRREHQFLRSGDDDCGQRARLRSDRGEGLR